jgi:4-amino-4-deoxy-L-arabinose transferase-like glycosyltransferase
MNPSGVTPDSRSHNRVLIALAALTILIHLLCSTGYGYFRDELYAIACSKHLAWGYVDQPPFSEFVLAIIGRVLGYSQFALRLVPALCGGLVALLMGLMARQLGGRRFAQALAATSYLVGGVYLAIASYYSMNCFDHLFWAMSIYLLVRILQGGDTRLWVLFGLVAGLGLENKYSMGFLGLGLIAGLALTKARKHFLDKWLWVGGALAALIFLPHVLWEVHHHFPTAEFIRNVTLKKNLPMTPWAFLLQCVLTLNPLTLPVWLAGLIYLLRGPKLEVRTSGQAFSGSELAVLGWTFLAAVGILLSTHSKPYYAAPAFLILLPPGGVAIEGFVARHKWTWLKPAYLAVLAAGGALLAPLAMPVLPVETFIRYQSWLGFKASAEERGEQALRLPQFFADRFGWPELTAQVAGIYNHLSPEEKAECVIGASNYGEAGAIDFFGKRYGLPSAISTHNNYWYWGPGDKPGKVLLVINGSKKVYEALYDDVQQVATITNPYAVESNVPIFLCRKPRHTLQEFWPHYHSFV